MAHAYGDLGDWWFRTCERSFHVPVFHLRETCNDNRYRAGDLPWVISTLARYGGPLSRARVERSVDYDAGSAANAGALASVAMSGSAASPSHAARRLAERAIP